MDQLNNKIMLINLTKDESNLLLCSKGTARLLDSFKLLTVFF